MHMISVFVIALFLYPSSAVPSSSLPGDGIVLISIKATIYDPDDRLDSWTTSDPTTYCSWTGVGCDNVGRVVTLDFSNMGLSGPFLNQVTNLSALRLLNVSYNLIESLPSDISKLKNLDVLDLYYNALSGELPLDLCNIEKLRLLNVSFNGFNGSLPSDISKLKNLEVLDVSYNDLSGTLPLDLSYFEKLWLLNVSHNHFNRSLPSDISKLKNLEVLDVSYNEFNGSLPSDISKLKNLEVLDVFHNALSGALPLDLSYLVKLRHLDLGGNSFSASIPGEFGKLKNVEYLSLSGNSLSGRIPRELGNLGNLKMLKLAGYIDGHIYFNKFDGGIAQEIGNLSKLVHLDMDRCGLSGEIPSELGGLRNLETMSLQGNGLTGEISFIGDLPRLEVLRLKQNNFQGPLPQQLGVSGQLLEVDVSFNRLTGSISPTLCKAGRLQILSVANNSFIGPIPGFLGTCNSLVEVRMGKNNFSGSIRADLLYLPKLTVIELDSNYLSGTIPEKINNVSSMLSIMDISDNCLSGSLPSSIGKLSALQQLLISSNQLTGNVPPEIGNCIALRSVDLSRNKFTGPIPAEISKISNLSYLNVSRNHLNESIPTEVQNMIKNLNILDFSYNDFSGILQVNSEFSLWDPSYYVGNPHLRVSYVSGSRHQAPLKRGLLLALGPLIFCSLVLPIWAVIRKSRIAKKEGDARSWEMTIFQTLDFGSNDIVGCIKRDNVIGKGGAGIVYRGIMPNGQQIAVKKLTRIGIGSSNDYGFSAEIQTVGKIRHRHIATLLAFCSNHDTNLLVYEYMPNGSLGELLHGNNGGHLQWDTRYKIAIEVAKGLCYLHHDCSPLILHRDVKSNNILLDSNFEAHVADFGLAKLLHHSATPECISSIAGSFGYIAPEYAYTLKVDEKSDVYSYGVVLLELITGKRAVEELEFEEGMNIAGWVKKMTNFDRRVVMKIIDPKLSTFSMEEAMHILFVALLCIQEQPVHRPSMREIVYILTHCKPTP